MPKRGCGCSVSEWDHLIGALRPQWCTVHERRADLGDPTRIDDILHRHRDLLQRIDALIRGSELRKPVRLRRQMDGDHLGFSTPS